TATAMVMPSMDALIEGSETVIVTVVDGPQYDVGTPAMATVTIADGNAPTSTTTSSSTSTSTTSSSTTTTLPPNMCEAFVDGPTFDSIACRIRALREQVLAESGLGTFQAKLTAKLVKVLNFTNQAIDSCRAGKLGPTRKRLKKAAKGLTVYRRMLASQAAVTKIGPTVRQSFLDLGEPMRADATTLRTIVACPSDAPAE
ncbi:MAG TPA: hypothetical protein VMS22_10180, partial [Candidatus Eisenbacteria bacterium]|nr:hypothetical protein [Candidatus Eisenbacteria bacterium]